MSEAPHHVNKLMEFLGASRSDEKLREFIRQFIPPPTITVDKEDGADDEYIEFKEHGFCFYFEVDVLVSIFLYSGKKDKNYVMYELPLPMGICFHNSKSEMIGRLEDPNAKGGGHDGFFGVVPEWIRFDNVDGHSVHIEFTSDSKSIGMVTLMKSKNK